MQNLYPDFDISSSNYVVFDATDNPASIQKSGQSIIFNNAYSTDAINTSGDLTTITRDFLARGGQYKIEVFVDNYSNGSARARLRGGTIIDLNVSGDGWSAPVTIIGGTSSGGLQFLGGYVTLDIVPDPDVNGDGAAIRIYTF